MKLSEYKGLPKPKEENERVKNPVSKLCCLPILLEGKKDYKRQLESMLMLKELLPKEHRIGICQMMYMSELLDMIREYNPDEDGKADPLDVISRMDESGMAQIFASMAGNTGNGADMSFLLSVLGQQNPMLSMLLPLVQGGGDFSSLLPMLMNMM